MSPLDPRTGKPLAGSLQRTPQQLALFEEVCGSLLHAASSQPPSITLSLDPTPRNSTVTHAQALRELYILYASSLTTVWTVAAPLPPPTSLAGAAVTSTICFGEAWPLYLQQLSALIKLPNHSDTSAWPQLLELGYSGGGADGERRMGASQEKVARAAPLEPLAFYKGHVHGELPNSSEILGW